jgi:hypothetical protein
MTPDSRPPRSPGDAPEKASPPTGDGADERSSPPRTTAASETDRPAPEREAPGDDDDFWGDSLQDELLPVSRSELPPRARPSVTTRRETDPAPPSATIGYRLAWEVTLAGRRTQRTGYRPEEYGPADPLPSRKRLRGLFHRARESGARFVFLRNGYGAAGLEETVGQARYLGFANLREYYMEACRLAMETVGPGGRRLTPIMELAPATPEDLVELAPYVDHFRYNLDVVDPRLLQTEALRGFPDHHPDAIRTQLEMYREAGAPVAVTMMTGIGESAEGWETAIEMLNDEIAAGLRLVGVTVVPFTPWPRTPMERAPIVGADEVVAAMEMLRERLGMLGEGPPPLMLQLEGRLDLLDLLSPERIHDIGFVTLNRQLMGGMLTEEHWFRENIGAPDRYREAAGEPLLAQGLRWCEAGGLGEGLR